MTYNINHADIYEWAKNYTGEPFDAVLCDPPYELGFMGKSWDSTGIAFNKDMWEAVFNILKPGGHLLAFSGSRTYHRMAVAIEDAGFEIRDMIEWVYGSGFPKSLNIGKAVDKIQGNERVVTGEYQTHDIRNNALMDKKGSMTVQSTKGTSPYEGYGTALKPAHEPCVLARKHIEGTVAQNALKYGTGGLNIDGSRVGTETRTYKGMSANQPDVGTFRDDNWQPKDIEVTATGRFPANLIHDGSDEVVGLFPQTKSGAMNSITKGYDPDTFNTYSKQYARRVINPASSGSAARFFYTAKASKSERNAGLEGFENDKFVAGNYSQSPVCKTCNKTLNGTNNHTECLGEVYYRKMNSQVTANHHPTVKPLSLTKYLANLIKPPTGGRLLVPFSGSGSEMIGALQAGWEHVEGVELTEEYIPIAEARIKYWLTKKDEVLIQTRLIS
jgi:site-specific DNA-methyltransferase (adenine-specific)